MSGACRRSEVRRDKAFPGDALGMTVGVLAEHGTTVYFRSRGALALARAIQMFFAAMRSAVGVQRAKAGKITAVCYF